MTYYGTRLSGHLSKREPEGFLICLNVPVARTGKQEYLREELGLPPGPEPVAVLRPEDEVFSPETVASFEGMPVTDDHPADPDGVNADNAGFYQKGHVQNVRRGKGKEADLLLADLIVTDPRLIDRILTEGKREISCGYNYTLCEENGRYIQRQIRGNHVAVVDAGRAGPRVCIKDRKAFPLRGRWPERPDEVDGGTTGVRISHTPHQSAKADSFPSRGSLQADCSFTAKARERSTLMKTNKLAHVLARMAKDGDIEEVAELIGELIVPDITEAVEQIEAVAAAPAEEQVLLPEEAGEPEETAEAPAEEEEQTAEDEDSILLTEILDRLERILALMTPGTDGCCEPEKDEDPEELLRPASDTYAALKRVSAARRDPGADLGRRIMAKRNPCMK